MNGNNDENGDNELFHTLAQKILEIFFAFAQV